MKKVFALLAMLAFSAVAQAVYVSWSLENSNYNVDGWKNQYGGKVYLVQAGQNASAAEVAGSVSSSGSGIFSNAWTSVGGGDGYTFSNVTMTEDSYYYLVIFKNGVTSSSEYVVSDAVQYTGTSATDMRHGIFNAESGETPEAGDFYMPGWMGGTWSAPMQTPEPTALALLALGVAGLALRRRVA